MFLHFNLTLASFYTFSWVLTFFNPFYAEGQEATPHKKDPQIFGLYSKISRAITASKHEMIGLLLDFCALSFSN